MCRAEAKITALKSSSSLNMEAKIKDGISMQMMMEAM